MDTLMDIPPHDILYLFPIFSQKGKEKKNKKTFLCSRT